MKFEIFLALCLAASMLPAVAHQQQPQTSAKAGQSMPASTSAKKPTASNNGPSDLLGSHNSNAPINVSSDNFIGDLATKVGTYIGNVVVIQGDMHLRADRVKVNVAQGKPTRIEATGKVVVNAPSGIATGDNGIYELGPHTITMTGHVVLTKEKDVMRGTKLVMDLNTNLAHLYAQGMPGNRVQGLFIPPPQQNSATGGAKKGKTGQGTAKPTRVQQTIDPSGTETTSNSPPK
jgi:lipopolysaccharide export system protein LptA